MTNEQAEIYDKLFEQCDKYENKYIKLMEFICIIVGFYIAVVSKIVETSTWNVDKFAIWNVIFSIVCITFAFFFIIIYLMKKDEYSMFEIREGMVQLKNEEELSKLNEKLYLLVRYQEKRYFSSLLLITCSLFFALNYFVSSTIIFIYFVIILIAFYGPHKGKI
ncbi:hypothetical protein ACSAZL_12480 [Methanosarcina sp. T3]|uniref:hypothetical protein n=1 Tax=Methanosarcina sp. T3 TaxID=3439062 RepID=UPI003F84F321